jgi:cellulose biosynthesis protein BcsQ
MVLSGLAGSASGLTAELTSSDAVLRAPLALSRRIGVAQLRGGVGASATTAYVANLLARRRSGMVLAVNASAGERHAVGLAGVAAPAAPGPQRAKRDLHRDADADRRVHPGSAADARAGLGVSGSGLYGLDLTRDRLSASAGTWLEHVSPIARFYDVVLTDWGVRDRRADLRQVAVTSHVVCLVARADRYAAEEAAALVPALQEVEDRPRLVLVLVDVGRTGGPTAGLLRRHLSVPVLTIPYEPLLAAEQGPDSRRLPARYRLAGIRLARALLTEAQHSDLRQRSLTALGRSVAEARS